MVNLANLHAYGDNLQRVVTSQIGVPYPSTPTGPYGTGWYDLGAISDNGVSESVSQNETKKYIWQGGQLGRTLRNQFEHPFTLEAAEENAVALGLARPGVTVTTTGGTAEVQALTFTGTPTAGTFPVTLPGYGSYTAAFNVPVATLATALSTAFGITVTVTGTVSSVYNITFPVGAGNVPGIQTNSLGLTGATIAQSTTTPGVNGINRSVVAPFSGVNTRQFGFDFIDTTASGTIHLRYILTNAEATLSGTIPRTANDLTILPFTISPIYDASIGGFFIDLNDDPARAAGLYA